jgi:hypothetical protein
MLGTIYDPLQREIDLPLAGTFFPLGFRAEIATNSQEVLAAAAESFGEFTAEFEIRVVQLRIVVQPEGDLAPEPVFRSQGHFFSIVSDRDNFAFYDSDTMFGYAFVSEKTAADHTWFRFHFLDTMCYMLLAQETIMPVHAACVAHGTHGVLLYGHSGAGKSTLAWACARAGWTYITDDGACLLPQSGNRTVLGKSRYLHLRDDARRLFPELVQDPACVRPHGKLSIEVPLSKFPQIQTATRTQVESVVVLNRQNAARAALQPLDAQTVADMLLQDMPWYGDAVHARYQQAVKKILEAPAWRLTYSDLDEAVAILSAHAARAPVTDA